MRNLTVALFLAGVVVATVAVMLFGSKSGTPLYPPAQRWLAPAGGLMLPMGVHFAWAGFGRGAEHAPMLSPWAAGSLSLSLAAAAIGAGLAYDHGDGWLLLAAPGAFACLPLTLWAISRNFDPRVHQTNPLVPLAGGLMMVAVGVWLAIEALS